MQKREQTEVQLVQASLGGNTQAFEVLVQKYQSLVCAITYSGTGRVDLSEELAQETLMLAWKNLGQLRDLEKFSAWLCRIARSTVQHWLRKRQRDAVSQAAPLEVAEGQPAGLARPDEAVIQQEQEVVIQQALDQVPEKYREVLVLYYREEKSAREVAELIGMNENAVRQRIARARALLKGQVAAMVETSLERSRPGTAFTATVMAGISALAIERTATAVLLSKGGSVGTVGTKTLLSGLGAKFFVAAAGVAVVVGIVVIQQRVTRRSDSTSGREQVATVPVNEPNEIRRPGNLTEEGNLTAPVLLVAGGNATPTEANQALDLEASGQTLAADASSPSTPTRAVLSGLVTDRDTDEPLAGVRIRLSGPANHRTETDVNGFYSFDKIKKDGLYRVDLTSDTHLALNDTGFSNHSPEVALKSRVQVVQNFALERGCRVKVMVFDEQQKPLKGAKVYVKPLSQSWRRYFARSHTTKVDGARIVGLFAPSEIPYRVTVWHDEFAPWHIDIPLTDPNVVVPVTAQLETGQDVSGFVEYADGVPAEGIRICVEPDWWHLMTGLDSAFIDGEGMFRYPHIVPGRYVIKAGIPIPGKTSWRSVPIDQIEFPLAGDGLLTLQIPQQSPGSLVSIRGRIQWTTGEKPERFSVYARHLVTDVQASGELSEDLASFWFDDLEPGHYRLDFRGDNIESKVLNKVTAPQEDLVVTLTYKAPLWLAGRVLDAQSQTPIPQFKARIIRRELLHRLRYSTRDEWFTCVDGEFKLKVHESGIYQVQILAEGYATGLTQVMDLKNPQPVIVNLSQGGQVTGQVVNGAGQPVSGALVVPLSTARGNSDLRGDEFTSNLGSVRTDKGRFHFSHLPPGEESFMVTHPEYTASFVRGVEVHDGEVTSCQPFKLDRGASVTGRVFDVWGKPMAKTAIFAKKYSMSSYYSVRGRMEENRLGSAVTDDQGRYRIDNLPPHQICYIMHQDPSELMGVQQRACMPQSGHTVQLDLGGTSVVQGVLEVDGKPLIERRIRIGTPENSRPSTLSYVGQADEQGRFRLYGVPPGHYGLYFEKVNQRNRWQLADTFHVDGSSIDLGVVPPHTALVKVHLTCERDAETQKTWDVYLQQGSSYHGGRVGTVERPQADGDPFVIRDVLPGTYQVVARPDGSKVTQRRVVGVSAGDRIKTVELQIPALSASLSGTFTSDAFGALILWRDDQTVMTYLTDREGDFFSEGLPAGRYQIGDLVQLGWAPIVFSTVVLKPGEHKVLDLDTRGWAPAIASLNLRVVSEAGHLLNDVELWLEQGGEQVVIGASYREGYSLLAAPGDYQLMVRCRGHQDYTETVALKQVNLLDPDHRSFRTIILTTE